jgi:acyl-CoA thioesterase
MANFNENLELRPGGAPGTIVMDTRPEHEVMPDTVHFAVLTTVAEVAAAGAVGAAVVPANVNVSLLRRARGGRLEGRGRVVKRGRTLTVAEGEVHQDGKIVAKAIVTFAMI